MLALKLLVQLIVSVLLVCVLLFAASVPAWRYAACSDDGGKAAAAAAHKGRCR